ncbi:MAG: class I SAM-dependent methyltransferase [Saprospiraceae bacterium]|nr:class I SAM-dependent methyltransferase [Saprospiraceae bacterium]MCB0624418.1 class I SAM-dependent methyltransferase [Saprospiraceae bacterium]MCB0677394.1 class I SAM-dependent methyltransferase [Saprospiraceae bacterium]MCB0679663.1 class I SAM-dependent methyltransferase [Saprospiraceae bacterium]
MKMLPTSLLALVLLLGWTSCFNSSKGPTEQELNDYIDSTLVGIDSSDVPLEESSFEERLANYESKDRVFWQKPDLVIDRLGDLSEKTVADIGAGSGYFARRLAHKAKRVIAVDIDEQFVEFMDSIKLVELPKELQGRFETRLATPEDAKLRNGEANIVLLVNTYIYVPNRIDYLLRLKEGLASGGTLVIIDFKKKRIPMNNPPADIRLPLYQVEAELEQAGYHRIISDDTSLDYQYIVMATRP